MIRTNFMEEIDCGNFFDHIDDLLEFPNDDIENGLVGTGAGAVDCDAFPPLWPENSPESELPVTDSVFSAANSNSASDLSAELSVPYEDIVQLEWLSNFVEDSFSGEGLTTTNYTNTTKDTSQSHDQFRTSSPISVLESSSSGSSNGRAVSLISHEKRARSKRPRPPTFTPRPTIQLGPESGPNKLVSDGQQQKKKKIIILPPSGSDGKNYNKNQNQNPNENAANHQAAVRKCMHCQITKTPQWRAGPMGPKTLCNACGVRYKSGRLFPEYRPAASPTFIPSVHSNSHKKVLEMRSSNSGDKYL